MDPTTTTTTTLAGELAALATLTTGELCTRYAELYGQPARTRHKAYLRRKVAWRLQARAEGGLTDRARRRAAELADDADVRVMPPKAPAAAPPSSPDRVLPAPTAAPQPPDPRLPPAGTALVRPYKGRQVRVLVRPDGFELDGEHFKTLTAVAGHVTGSHVNGFRFFRLDKPAAPTATPATEARP